LLDLPFEICRALARLVPGLVAHRQSVWPPVAFVPWTDRLPTPPSCSPIGWSGSGVKYLLAAS
jgi:hypothetical protein